MNWIAFIGWGIVTVGILLSPKEWMRVMGLTAGVLELVVGIPLAISTTIGLERFSLFSLGPIFSLLLVVAFAIPSIWHRLTSPEQSGALPEL
ncbi:MAG: hypothetical protein MUO76_10695 [Anaerolineaceae bacterium]|nr:hypothetical protein [Anaerolineaceae bacterium]